MDVSRLWKGKIFQFFCRMGNVFDKHRCLPQSWSYIFEFVTHGSILLRKRFFLQTIFSGTVETRDSPRWPIRDELRYVLGWALLRSAPLCSARLHSAPLGPARTTMCGQSNNNASNNVSACGHGINPECSALTGVTVSIMLDSRRFCWTDRPILFG